MDLGIEVARRRVSAALGVMFLSLLGRAITSVPCSRAISCRRRLETKLGDRGSSAITTLDALDRAACSNVQSRYFGSEKMFI
jgi:hypothetical protein